MTSSVIIAYLCPPCALSIPAEEREARSDSLHRIESRPNFPPTADRGRERRRYRRSEEKTAKRILCSIFCMNLYCFCCRCWLCGCLLTIAIACAFSHHLFLALSHSPRAIPLLSPCATKDSVQMGFSLLPLRLARRLIAELFDLNAVPAPLPSQRNHFGSRSHNGLRLVLSVSLRAGNLLARNRHSFTREYEQRR